MRETWYRVDLKELANLFVSNKLPEGAKFTVTDVYIGPENHFAIRAEVEELIVIPEEPTEASTEKPVCESCELYDAESLMSALEIMLRFEEGYRLEEYKDSKGKPTIGIGHLILPVDRERFHTNSRGKLELTAQQAEELFCSDVAWAVAAAKKWLGAYWTTLSTVRQAVCVSMAFQMGETSLQDFGPTREHIIRGEWGDVHEHFLRTKWYKDTPERVERMGYIMVYNKFPSEYKQ
jgi:lysozyme